MILRRANDADAKLICDLHIASITYFCSDFYPENAIKDWVSLKSPKVYQNLNDKHVIFVLEESNLMIGFGWLNLAKSSIDSLYMAPGSQGKGHGKTILNALEKVAKENKISELELFSTFNAESFYTYMGYNKCELTIHKLSTGTELGCIRMVKKL